MQSPNLASSVLRLVLWERLPFTERLSLPSGLISALAPSPALRSTSQTFPPSFAWTEVLSAHTQVAHNNCCFLTCLPPCTLDITRVVKILFLLLFLIYNIKHRTWGIVNIWFLVLSIQWSEPWVGYSVGYVCNGQRILPKDSTQQARTDTATTKSLQSIVTWNVASRTLPNSRGKREKPVFLPSQPLISSLGYVF